MLQLSRKRPGPGRSEQGGGLVRRRRKPLRRRSPAVATVPEATTKPVQPVPDEGRTAEIRRRHPRLRASPSSWPSPCPRSRRPRSEPRSRSSVRSTCPRMWPTASRSSTRDEFRAVPAAAASSWDIAPKTGSGLGGKFTLAQLDRIGARSWRFEWAKEARNQSTQVTALPRCRLEVPGPRRTGDLRPAARVETRDKRPIPILEKQPLLFDRLDPRSGRSPGRGTPRPSRPRRGS